MNDEPHHQWGFKPRSQCFHRSRSWRRSYAMCWINAFPWAAERCTAPLPGASPRRAPSIPTPWPLYSQTLVGRAVGHLKSHKRVQLQLWTWGESLHSDRTLCRLGSCRMMRQHDKNVVAFIRRHVHNLGVERRGSPPLERYSCLCTTCQVWEPGGGDRCPGSLGKVSSSCA
jgi:hypothetical protein